MGRVALAFAAAVFAFPLFILLSGTPDAWGGALRVGAMTATGVLGVGVPAFLLFHRRRWWELWKFVAGGALGGLLCVAIFMNSDAPNFWFFAILFAAGSACHAALFWLIAAWRNPQLTMPARFRLPDGATYRTARRTQARIRPTDRDI
jgi:hypothetical protein